MRVNFSGTKLLHLKSVQQTVKNIFVQNKSNVNIIGGAFEGQRRKKAVKKMIEVSRRKRKWFQLKSDSLYICEYSHKEVFADRRPFIHAKYNIWNSSRFKKIILSSKSEHPMWNYELVRYSLQMTDAEFQDEVSNQKYLT